MKHSICLPTLTLCLLLLWGCGPSPGGVGPSQIATGAATESSFGSDASTGVPPSGFAPPANGVTLAAPIAIPFFQVLGFLNPCTGLQDTATITGTLWIHPGAAVVRQRIRATTSGGFEGEQTRTIVENGHVFKVSTNAMLAHASGQRLRLHFVQVVDLSAGIVRVQQGGGGPVCIGG